MSELKIGDKAPDFTLPNTDDHTVSLNDLTGKPVVLYFYPKDDTSGCTLEAIDFTTLSDKFNAIGVRVFGISPDSTKQHRKFCDKHNLAVELLADEDKTTLSAYGVWVEKSMYGRKYMGVERTTFLLDGNGKIVEIWHKVKVTGHAERVLEAAKNLV